MKTSQNGISLIKQFEGCKLTAYHLGTEKYNTIGYGHTGADVTPGMVISQAQADMYLIADLAKFEAKVNKYAEKYGWNQNQFDALVSFAYNVGSVDALTNKGRRTNEQIADALLSYNKTTRNGVKVELLGLTKRRKAERELFLRAEDDKPKTGNPYREPTETVRLNSKGNAVRWVQFALNEKGGYKLIVDGVAGMMTVGAVEDFQRKNGLTVDGIVGAATRAALK